MMSENIYNTKQTAFEQIKHTDKNGNEHWTARDLSNVIKYSEYRHFKTVIEKAKKSCLNSYYDVNDHFEDILEMVEIGSGAKRKTKNIKLSRYTCYLIVQNADPSKEIVAQGQTYFAMQTRLQEIREMDDYNSLDTEEKKRLFLRNELKAHNSQLAMSAQNYLEYRQNVLLWAKIKFSRPESIKANKAIFQFLVGN